MNQTRLLEVSESTFAIVAREAALAGVSPSNWLALLVEHRFPKANGVNANSSENDEAKLADRQRLNRHIGSICVPNAVGADNEQIDADIADHIADNHEAS